MEVEYTFEELVERAEGKMQLAKELNEMVKEKHGTIPGVERLQRKVMQEVKFLEDSIANKTLKYTHLMCSNLVHYEYLVKVLDLQVDVQNVDCVFRLVTREKPLRVDIVAEQGLKWIKVIARNAKSIQDAAKGNTHFGARSIFHQAHDYLEASALHPCMFQLPEIVFYFAKEIDQALREKLCTIGIKCTSLQFPLVNDNYSSRITQTLNLDITTMVAYVSNMTNGSPDFIYKEPLLTEQAARERRMPIKPILLKLFEGKELICCEAAHDGFQNILTSLGGPKEIERAKELMQRVIIHPNIEELPPLLEKIDCTAHVNERSLKIFGFGISMRAITVTSNKAFVQSTKMQLTSFCNQTDVDVPVFIHESRALTEHKEATGQPVVGNQIYTTVETES